MNEAQPTPEDEEAARLAELERREKALGQSLDDLEKETTRKPPEPPPVGGMVGT